VFDLFFSGDYFACVYQSIYADLSSMWLRQQKKLKIIIFAALNLGATRSNFVHGGLQAMEKFIY
jgi:hypothetical protein